MSDLERVEPDEPEPDGAPVPDEERLVPPVDTGDSGDDDAPAAGVVDEEREVAPEPGEPA